MGHPSLVTAHNVRKSPNLSWVIIVALICLGSETQAFGLGDDFGRMIVVRILTVIIGYLPFAIGVGLAVWFLWKGRKVAAAITATVVALIFVAYPLIDQRHYYNTRDKVMSAFTFPTELDLTGRNILYIGHSIYGSGCRGACILLGRHGHQASLHSAHIPKDDSAAFYQSMTDPIDLTTLQLVQITANPEEFRGVHDEWLAPNTVQEFDYVIFDGLNDEIAPALAAWYDGEDIARGALMNDWIFVAVDDPRNFDLGKTTPDIFVPYHRGRFQTVPLNPALTKSDQINNSWSLHRVLAPFLCPDVTEDKLKRCRRDL